MKNYKKIFLLCAVFLVAAIAPAERVQKTIKQIPKTPPVVEVPPPDLSELADSQRENHELYCDLVWLMGGK